MDPRQLIGIVLIALVVGLFFLWLRFQRRQERASESGGIQEVTILVKGAYDPNVITAKAGIPLRIHFNRQEDTDCSRFVTFDTLHLRKNLKSFSTTEIEFTPEKAGEYPFACDMGMYQGKLIVK